MPELGQSGNPRAYALVDADDHDWLSETRWYLHSKGYVVGRPRGQRMERLHRVVLGLEAGDARVVDHKNGDRLDNRRANLRVVSGAQNAHNLAGLPRTSRYRGVSFDHRRGLWRATAQVSGRKHQIGRFATEEEAARAASEFRRLHMSHTVEDRPDAPRGGQHGAR